MASRVENRRLVTYGDNPQAEVRAVNIVMGPEGADFDVLISPREGEPVTLADIRLPMAGWHNVLNALAAIAVARELGVADGGDPRGPGRLRRRAAAVHHHRRRAAACG